MRFDNGISLIGEVEVVVRDKFGNEKFRDRFKNTLVKVGLEELLKIAFGLVSDAFTYIAIGSGSTPETLDDTTLESEIARKVATRTSQTSNFTGDTIEMSAMFTALEVGNILAEVKEAGVFSEQGIMLSRRTFPVVNVDFGNGDTITITWRFRIQSG